MATQQQGLISAWNAQPSAVTVVVEEDLVPNEEVATSAQISDGMERVSGPPALSEPLIRAGDVVLASTILTNDSDTPGPVVAEIRKGPLRGAHLLGGFEANQGNTHLIVRFGTAVLADGTQSPVSAYAVDARQKSLAVRSDLDRRLFARYNIYRSTVHWRYAMARPRLAFFDARLVFFIILFVFHIRWWTFALLVFAIAGFTAAGYFNYALENVLRLSRSRLVGPFRPAVTYTRLRPMVDYGSDALHYEERAWALAPYLKGC